MSQPDGVYSKLGMTNKWKNERRWMNEKKEWMNEKKERKKKKNFNSVNEWINKERWTRDMNQSSLWPQHNVRK